MATLDLDEQELWQKILAYSGESFLTAKGLSFTYTVRGAEMFVDRKEKSITRATVLLAYRRACELGGIVPCPKALGVFGASYLYPVFREIGVIMESSV